MTHSARVSAGSTRRVSRNRNAVSHRSSVSLGPISNMLIVGLILTAMGLLYLVQITKTSVYGFEVNELKETQTELTQENQSLRVEAARLQSLQRISDSDLVQEFQPTEELSFLPR